MHIPMDILCKCPECRRCAKNPFHIPPNWLQQLGVSVPEAYVSTMGSRIGPVTSLPAEQTWVSVKSEIRDLIECSSLGERLFGWVAKELAGVEIETVIKEKVGSVCTSGFDGDSTCDWRT